jgi:hypothetical protein
MEKISWTDHVRNEEVLLRVSEQRNILHEIRKMKAYSIGRLSVVSVVYLSRRGLCDGLITRPEESYRLWCVLVCDLKTSRLRRLKRASGL